MLPRSATARLRVAAAAASASPTGSAGSSTVHPESGSLSARELSRGQGSSDDSTPARKKGASPVMKKSRGQMLWGKARDVAMDAVDPDRNPDSNTFRPSGAVTEEDAREALIRKRDPLRGKKMKLLAYTVLLLVFLATSMGARPTLDIYSQNSVLENLMMMRVDEESGMKQQELGIAWSFITTEEDFWLYLSEGIPGGLHSEELSPGRDLAAVELLTGYRIKQIRVAKEPCKDKHPFVHTRTTMCTPSWDVGQEETKPYGPGNIWTHSKQDNILGADLTMRGFIGDYPLGGYVVHNVSTNVDEFVEMIEWLRESKWVDTQTRQVQIDINAWNPTLRLISAIKLQAEFSVVGKVRTMYTIRTFEYKEWVDISRASWWWEIIYVVMILTYATEEVYGVVKMHWDLRKTKTGLLLKKLEPSRKGKGKQSKAEQKQSLSKVVEASLQAKREFAAVRKAIDEYMSDPWNYMDMTNYTIAIVVIVMEMWSRSLLQLATNDLNEAYPGNRSAVDGEDHGEFDAEGFFSHFVCFYAAAYMSAYAYTLMGLNAVVTWLKILKYLNLFPHLSMLSITLRNAAYPVISFSVMFFIVFLSCGQAFLLAFGPSLRDFSTFGEAMMSLFRALLGDFDYPSLADADPVVGPILFSVYIFLVLFVLLNMFIAILTEAYEKAKVEVFGDAVHEREECWEGAVPFLEYLTRAIGYGIRWTVPCLSNNQYLLRYDTTMDNGAFGIPEDDDVAKDVEKPDSPLNAKFKRAAEKATEKATGARDKAVSLSTAASFDDWLEARYKVQKLVKQEEGKAEVEEVAELVKAAASPVYHEAFALGRPGEKSTSKGVQRAVKLMVGSYGLVQLEKQEYTTYIYQTLKQWDFGPKKGLPKGQLRLTVESDEPGGSETEQYFLLPDSDEMSSMEICDFISRGMMSCAMAEHADTFSTTLALKVLRLQMEQTEAQLQSTVNEIRSQVGSMAVHVKQSRNLLMAQDVGPPKVELPGGGAGRTPTKLPPIEDPPDAPDVGLGESALTPALSVGQISTPALVPPTELGKGEEQATEPAAAEPSPGARKPRQP